MYGKVSSNVPSRFISEIGEDLLEQEKKESIFTKKINREEMIAKLLANHFINGEENILVHCMGGTSRSPTFVIAYIMWKYNLPYKKAFELVNSIYRELFGWDFDVLVSRI